MPHELLPYPQAISLLSLARDEVSLQASLLATATSQETLQEALQETLQETSLLVRETSMENAPYQRLDCRLARFDCWGPPRDSQDGR